MQDDLRAELIKQFPSEVIETKWKLQAGIIVMKYQSEKERIWHQNSTQ